MLRRARAASNEYVCVKLREIATLNDDDKTVVRTTWPRIENGKQVRNESPSQADIAVQRNLDSMRAIISRINTYARLEGMKL